MDSKALDHLEKHPIISASPEKSYKTCKLLTQRHSQLVVQRLHIDSAVNDDRDVENGAESKPFPLLSARAVKIEAGEGITEC